MLNSQDCHSRKQLEMDFSRLALLVKCQALLLGHQMQMGSIS